MYPSGLESVGVYVGDQLDQLKERYKHLLGVKDHGKYCQPAFITFDNQKTMKFYDLSLIEIIGLQGWQFEQLSQPRDSHDNTIAEIVNTWQWYFHTIEDWKTLIKNSQPKKALFGLVYELNNPIHRPNEIFAIADLRTIQFVPSRHHAETEIYFVLDGNGSVTVSGKEKIIEKGSTLVIPANRELSIRSKKDLVLAIVSVPLRA